MKKRKIITSILMFIAVLEACFSAAYLIGGLIFRKADGIGPMVQFLLTSLLGLIIFGFLTTFLRIIFTKFYKNERGRIYSELLAAITRISQGDFNVFVEENEHDMHLDLAQGINRMAQKLGTMEQLRQDFISNVSHEIQSPLTSIGGFAALLKNEGLSPELHRHYLDIIETESKRLSKLSDNLLKLSALENKNQPLTLQEFALDKQLSGIILSLEPQWKEKDLKLDIDLNRVSVQADQDLLNQVWVNLLHNAVKFTPENGTIAVRLTKEKESAVVVISDTGVGISEEDQPHIFERFFKADKARDRSLGGSGLGLAIVKKIVELHDGTIAIKSRPGEGSEFTVRLPGLQSV